MHVLAEVKRRRAVNEVLGRMDETAGCTMFVMEMTERMSETKRALESISATGGRGGVTAELLGIGVHVRGNAVLVF